MGTKHTSTCFHSYQHMHPITLPLGTPIQTSTPPPLTQAPPTHFLPCTFIGIHLLPGTLPFFSDVIYMAISPQVA